MTSLDRVRETLQFKKNNLLPILPIIHTGLASALGVPLGRFFSDADVMADVMVQGCKTFGFDGIQLSSGVTAEVEALGARVEQPENGAPLLKEHLLADLSRLEQLSVKAAPIGGRMPLFFSAVQKTVQQIGSESFVLATLRGPLINAAQLRGVEQVLIDLLEQPEAAEKILDFTTELVIELGSWLVQSGAHGLLLGEATCSPNFISPTLYRTMVLPRHRTIVRALKAAGWPCVGFHICGNTLPIIADVVSTGADFMDIDYQVPVQQAVACTNGAIALRGNLDPSSLFRFGNPAAIQTETQRLCTEAHDAPWIMSSGCDIPPSTPTENIDTFVKTINGHRKAAK